MGRRKATAFDRAAEQKTDDYVNQYTGIGDWTRDRMLGGRMTGQLDFLVRLFTYQEAADRWRGSDLGCRLIEAIPDEMTREGWELSIQPYSDEDKDSDEADDNQKAPGKVAAEKADAFGPPGGDLAASALLGEASQNKPKPIEEKGNEEKELAEDIDAKLDELGACEAVTKALQYERAYGGSVILMGLDDGVKDLTQPLNEENIKAINYLNVFAGGRDGECTAWTYYNDPKSANFGKPEVYQIRNYVPVGMPGVGSQVQQGATQVTFYVHESRLLVFPGNAVSHRERVNARGWGDSIFTRIDEVLSQYSQTWGGVANLMSQLHVDVLKMSGLARGLASGNQAAKANPITTRAQQINMTKSIARMLVIDSEEEFERASAALAGIKDVLDAFALRLAAAADMPLQLLMGQGGASLNKGDADIRFFYDRIAARQKRHLLPRLKRLYKLVMLSKDGPCAGVEPDMWDVKFRPLTQLTDLEQATLRKTVAETDQIYINAGVLSAEEVAASAYGGTEYSMERTIDFDGREQMAEQDAKDAEDRKAMAADMMKQHQEATAQMQQIPGKPQNKG